jgi:glutamate-ammonia-ligase adenylyltransferase
MHYASDLDLFFLYDAASAAENTGARALLQKEHDERVERILEILAKVLPEGIAYSVDLRLRPGGASGLLARSWESFLEYSHEYMQPWERMALVRSRMLDDNRHNLARWDSMLSAVVYEHDWDANAYESIRHVKRRIEAEKNRETRTNLDFKYGKGGIADLEFLMQFLQIKHGRQHKGVRVPGLKDAVLALCQAGILSVPERDAIMRAHQFERLVENRYQLMEEWTSREISRESPLIVRLAASMGYRGDASAVRKAFLGDWDETARSIRRLVEEYFFAATV